MKVERGPHWRFWHVIRTWQNPLTQARGYMAILAIVTYAVLAWLHSFSDPADITFLVQNELNRQVFEATHSFMTAYPWPALFFKLVYYFGFSLSLLMAPIYLVLVNQHERLDRLIAALIVSYIIAFPIFFTAVAYEPVVVGWGHWEDILLYEGQTLEGTNFMTTPAFCLPSGHTFLTTICALAVVGTKRWPRYFLYAMAILVPISTILLTQHWVEDVITGYALGFFAFYVSRILAPHLSTFMYLFAVRIQRFWARFIPGVELLE